MANIKLGNLPFPSWELTSTKANRTLGRFVTAWGQVETVCEFVFRSLSDVPTQSSIIVFGGYITTAEQIEIIIVLSEEILEDSKNTRIQSVMKRVKELSVKRNKIIHGQWGTLDDREARFWRGLSQKHITEIAFNKKPSRRKDNIFTLEDMTNLTKEAENIREELIKINRDLIQEKLKRLLPTP